MNEFEFDGLSSYRQRVVLFKQNKEILEQLSIIKNMIKIPHQIDTIGMLCGVCHKELTLVRPGKYQCDNPDCHN